MRTFLALLLLTPVGVTVGLTAQDGDTHSTDQRVCYTTSTADPEEYERWAAFVQDLPDDPEAMVAMLETYRIDYGIPLSFWPRETVPDSVVLAAGAIDHPCGWSLIRSVRSIPDDDELIIGELVLEYDSEGEIIREWHVPIDLTVAGLIGDEIVLWLVLPRRTEPRHAHLALKTDGTFRFTADLVEQEFEFQQCPPLEPFKDSVYDVCFPIKDDNHERWIAYQIPCT